MADKSVVYSPQEVGALTVELLQDLRSNRTIGLRTGIDPLDEVMLPMRPGELVTVVGYTSHYKSGFMNFLARSAIRQCREGDVVVKVTWEQSVEEDTLSWLAADSNTPVTAMVMGNADWDIVMQAYAKRITVPLWIVGHSSLRSEERGKPRPRITMTDVLNACEYISVRAIDGNQKIRMVVLDYLQRIRPDATDGNTKREQMMEAVNKAKDLAVSLGCVVVLGVQASRGVQDREFKLPRLDDGQETSNIEQSSDRVISLWYPIKTEPPGSKLEDGTVITENVLICGLLKQKLGVAPVVMPLYVDPGRNILAGIEKGVKE